MAHNLQQLKKRIKTSQSIAQITKAMEMIAASKIRKAQTCIEKHNPYADKIKEVVQRRPTAEVPVDEGGNIPIESQLNRFTVDTSSPQLQEAAAQWRTCMAPQGIADLPQEPWATEIRREMPESLQTRLNFQLTGQPSADEIAVATADAQCRESSGWTSLLYEATWNQQAAFIAAHKAEIDTVVANNDAEAERMRGIIREAGGTP